MNETYQILISIFVAILITLPTLKWYQNVIEKRKLQRKQAKKELILLLTDAIRDLKIKNYKDFSEFIYGFENYKLIHSKRENRLANLALNAKHNLFNDNFDIESKENLDNIIKEIDEINKEIKLREPFKNVPTAERNLLMDVLEISQLKSSSVFLEKLHRLGDLIKIREELITKAGKDSEASLRIAKQSKILAILFFIISLGLTIYSIWR